ncbi:hypothetical protein [Nocardioides terrigena]|uniref:hypothetical protein n=1 Tax=Nocardioides terrigena TaxID=424797 RepID=UPI00131EEE9A|nr:hypothetical protein [Nocardioides terrigena]
MVTDAGRENGVTHVMDRRVREVVYRGDGREVHLSTVDKKLGATSAAFRRFVNDELTRAWRQLGGSVECKQAPTLTVKKWRADGFATIPNIGIRISDCGGGGYHALYVKTAKGWSAPRVLGAQEPYFCTDLLGYRIPGGYSLGECYPDVGNDPVRYRARTALPPATPTYAAETLVRNVMASSPVGADRWAKPDVVTELFEARNDGMQLSVRLCVTSSDPTYGQYLDGARRGCIVRAAYYEDPPPALPVYAYEWMMPLKRAALGRWRGSSLTGLGGT